MKPENPQGLSGEEVWDLVAYVSAMPAEAEVNTAANKVADLKVPAAVGGVTSAMEGRP
jgi:cytochrome c